MIGGHEDGLNGSRDSILYLAAISTLELQRDPGEDDGVREALVPREGLLRLIGRLADCTFTRWGLFTTAA